MIVFCAVNSRLHLEEQLWKYVDNCKGIHKFCSYDEPKNKTITYTLPYEL
jgi:hypothetical protein